MHGLWDTQLIAKYLRELHNYTQPLPSKQIESALTGSIYDSYVRWIVWEGIRQWWVGDLESWLRCPIDDFEAKQNDQSAQRILASPQQGAKAYATGVVCPASWAKEPQTYNCGYVYPPNFDTTQSPVQLTPAYVDKVKNDKIIESLLAKGGLRLAATLNTILGDESDLRAYGPVSTGGRMQPPDTPIQEEGSKNRLDWLRRGQQFLRDMIA